MHQQATVLHVDDNAAFRDLTAEFLERVSDDLEVRSEADPRNVVDRVGEEAIECVVSDFDMPERTGLELCRRFRAEYPDLPFLLFTNNTDPDLVEEAIETGATDYILKESGTHHYRLLANRILLAVTRYRALQQLERLDVSPDTVRHGILK